MLITTCLIADTHVHLYPQYSLKDLPNNILLNFYQLEGLKKLTPNFRALYLTDTTLNEGVLHLQREEIPFSLLGDGVIYLPETSLYIVPGIQLRTTERLEVCGLCLPLKDTFPPCMTLEESLTWVKDRGGFPIIPWSFGKWWGRRGEVVKPYLRNKDLRLGDIKFRGFPWPMPFRKDTIYGSDPLPFSGEEKKIGTALSVFSLPTTETTFTLKLAKDFVQNGQVELLVGSKDCIFGQAFRLIKFYAAKS